MVQQAAYQNRSIHRPHATTSIYDQVEYNRSEPRTPPLRINVDARRLTQQRRDAGSGNRVTVVGQTSRERMTSGSGVQLMRSASIRSSANVNAGPNGDVSLRAILLSESGSARTRTVRRTRPTPVPDAAVANNIRTDTLNSPAGSVVINDNTHSSYIELMRTPNARTLAQTRSDHIAQIERARTGVTVATNAHTGGNIVQPFVPNTPDILHDAMDTSDDDMFIEALIRTDGYHSSQEAEENPRDVLRTALRQSGARSSVPTARDPAVAIETDTSPQSRARGSGEGVVHTSRVPVMSLAQYEAQRHAQISALTAQAQVRPLPYTPYTDTQIQPLPYTDTQIQPLPYTDTQTQPPLQGGESIPARGEGNMRLRDGSINFQSHQFRSRMARAMRTSQIAQQQFEAKAVCTITCRFCESELSDRGMRAILLGDTNVELYSTDLPPTDTLGLVGEDYTTKNCACQIKDSACLTCGNVMGYHVTQPCASCLEACHNGHFWMLHSDATKAQELFTTDGMLMRWGGLTKQSEEDLACFQQYGDLPKCLAKVECIR